MILSDSSIAKTACKSTCWKARIYYYVCGLWFRALITMLQHSFWTRIDIVLYLPCWSSVNQKVLLALCKISRNQGKQSSHLEHSHFLCEFLVGRYSPEGDVWLAARYNRVIVIRVDSQAQYCVHGALHELQQKKIITLQHSSRMNFSSVIHVLENRFCCYLNLNF